MSFSGDNIEIMDQLSYDLGPLQMSRNVLDLLLQDKLEAYNIIQKEE